MKPLHNDDYSKTLMERAIANMTDMWSYGINEEDKKCCNKTGAGSSCPMHGDADCNSSKKNRKEEFEILEYHEIEVDGETIIIEKTKMDGVDDNGSKTCWKGYKKQGTKSKGGKEVNNCVKSGYEPEGDTIEEKNGLYANIHAKKKRGESPAKSGSEDYPAPDAFKKSAKTAKKEEVEHMEEKKDMPGSQEKIDANKNGKVDAHDFAILRNKRSKKTVKEMWELAVEAKAQIEVMPELDDKDPANVKKKEKKEKSC